MNAMKGTQMADLAYPIKLDEYSCAGTDANGERVMWDDLLFEGQLTGPSHGHDNVFPPFGRVVKRDDGLWVEAAPDEDEKHRERTLAMCRAAA